MRTRLTERDLNKIVRNVKGKLNEGVVLGCTTEDFEKSESVTIVKWGTDSGMVTFSNGYKCSVQLLDPNTYK